MYTDLKDYLKTGLCSSMGNILDVNNDYFNYKNSDFQAWDNCFDAFERMRMKQYLTDEDIDYLCLHLTAYLAVWGMYRGSCFISKRDYTVHKKTVRCVMKPEYDDLMKLKVADCTVEKANKIINLYNEIKDAYKPIGKTTDTLITKIMLGTLACVPGYDTYVTNALSNLKIQKAFPKKESKLCEIFESLNKFHIIEAEALKLLRDKEQPEMKIIDFCLFFYGQQLSEKEMDK